MSEDNTEPNEGFSGLTDEMFDSYGIMSDEDLRKLASLLGFKINKIMFDESIDPKAATPFGFNIINLGDETMGGTHWCLWFNPRGTPAMSYYFDSYGAPPEDNIVKLCERKRKSIMYNRTQIQGYDEQHCGIWCLLMARALSQSKNKDHVSTFERFIEDNRMD